MTGKITAAKAMATLIKITTVLLIRRHKPPRNAGAAFAPVNTLESKQLLDPSTVVKELRFVPTRQRVWPLLGLRTRGMPC